MLRISAASASSRDLELPGRPKPGFVCPRGASGRAERRPDTRQARRRCYCASTGGRGGNNSGGGAPPPRREGQLHGAPSKTRLTWGPRASITPFSSGLRAKWLVQQARWDAQRHPAGKMRADRLSRTLLMQPCAATHTCRGRHRHNTAAVMPNRKPALNAHRWTTKRHNTLA